MILKLNESKSFIRMLLHFRVRPGMYVGGRGSTLLIGFIHGIIVGYRIDQGTSHKSEIEFIENLLKNMGNKLEYIRKIGLNDNQNRVYALHERLLIASNNDEEKAFDLFFELWDEFVKEKGIVFEWDEGRYLDTTKVTNVNYKDLYEHLEIVRKRPGMFIGKQEIESLFIYIAGYRGFIVFNNFTFLEDPLFEYFHDYIAVILGYESSTAGWANMLNEYYKDPKIALDKFFEHLDDFKRDMKGKNCLEIGEFLKSKGYELHYNFSAEFGCR